MGHESIKLELIEWLMQLEDDETINFLKIVKDSDSANQDWWKNITRDQKEGIARGLEDIDQDKTIPDDQIRKKYGL